MNKAKVKKILPDSFCVRLTEPINHMRFLVWPGRVGPRGTLHTALGYGRTATEAWRNALTILRRIER